MEMTALRIAKKELRQRLRQAMVAMTDTQRKEQSEKLVKKFLACEEYLSSKRISVYLSMPNEVQTEPILQDIFSSGRVCFIPRYESSSMDMDMVRVHSMEEIKALPKTKWNIQQPPVDEEREVALASGGLDLIVFPGVGFTKEGHRIGWGMGFYDRYYAKCRQAGFKPKTVALAYSAMRCDQMPMSEEDTTVDRVIFPDD